MNPITEFIKKLIKVGKYMDPDNVISTLNDLIQTSNDGEKGFRASSENVTSAELKALFIIAANRQ